MEDFCGAGMMPYLKEGMSSDSLLPSPFFQANGRTIIVPIDHGTAIPVPGLEDMGAVIESLSAYADGFVVNYGVARAFQPQLAGKAVCLRADVYKPALSGHTDSGAYLTYGATEAVAVGADAVMSMLYPQHANEAQMFRENAALLSGCHAAGVPVIIEALPYGLGQSAHYTPAEIGFAVRAAAELGADVVKTAWPGDAAAFGKITAACFVPVIVLGGAATDAAGILTMVEQSIKAGGAGIAIGRNVWQQPDPLLMLKRLHAVVHGGATAAEAMELS
jgi:DhnA family fructose-bisphosphate aldolase class Ia